MRDAVRRSQDIGQEAPVRNRGAIGQAPSPERPGTATRRLCPRPEMVRRTTRKVDCGQTPALRAGCRAIFRTSEEIPSEGHPRSQAPGRSGSTLVQEAGPAATPYLCASVSICGSLLLLVFFFGPPRPTGSAGL